MKKVKRKRPQSVSDLRKFLENNNAEILFLPVAQFVDKYAELDAGARVVLKEHDRLKIENDRLRNKKTENSEVTNG